MRRLIQLAYAVRRRLLALLRVRTRGAKVLLFNAAGDLMLIRNSYGDRELFVLPGGGVGRGEDPADTARREIREELGIVITRVDLVATYRSEGEGKRDSIALFTATTADTAVTTSREIDEAGFFPLDALPKRTSKATLRRLAELSGDRAIDGRW